MISKPARPIKPARRAAARAEKPRASEPPELLSAVGRTLRALRVRKGYSLERLAKVAGVSRAMLSQIELAQSAPTITLLWRVAAALDVPFSALLGTESAPRATLLLAREAVRLRSERGGLVSRPLFPVSGGPRRTEFYELEVAPRAVEHSLAHPAGTLENLVVARGQLVVRVGGEVHPLGCGDALQFQADVEHTYVNEGDGAALIYLAITYATELL